MSQVTGVRFVCFLRLPKGRPLQTTFWIFSCCTFALKSVIFLLAKPVSSTVSVWKLAKHGWTQLWNLVRFAFVFPPPRFWYFWKHFPSPGNDLIANPCLQPKCCQYYNDLFQMFQKISSRYLNASADERLAFVPLHSFVTLTLLSGPKRGDFLTTLCLWRLCYFLVWLLQWKDQPGYFSPISWSHQQRYQLLIDLQLSFSHADCMVFVVCWPFFCLTFDALWPFFLCLTFAAQNLTIREKHGEEFV